MAIFSKMLAPLFKPINPHLNALMGVLTLLWGTWVLFPWWDAFASAKLFIKMVEFAPEWAWGLWAFMSGAILIHASLRDNYRSIVRALAFIAWHWWTVSTLMWFSDWQNTGPVTYSMITIYAIFCYFNIKENYLEPKPRGRFKSNVQKILRNK